MFYTTRATSLLARKTAAWIGRNGGKATSCARSFTCLSSEDCSPVNQLGRAKRIWYSSPMQAAKVQASLRIRAVSPEPPLLAHTSSESRGTFRQKARSLALLNGWACAVKVCHDGMLEDTNSLGGAQLWREPHQCHKDVAIAVLA